MINLTNTTIGEIEPTDKEMNYPDSKFPKLKLRVPRKSELDKDPIKVFYLYYSINGQKRKYRIGKFGDISLPTARKAAEKLLAEIALGNDPQADRKLGREGLLDTSSLRAFLDNHYYPYYKAEKKGHAAVYRLIERCWAKWMNKPLLSIDTKLATQWRNGELTRGIKKKTLNHQSAVLKAILSKAVDLEILESSPLSKFKQLKVDKGGVVRYLSSAEEKRLYDTIYKRTDLARTIIILMLNTGARKMETLSLTWSDIDLVNNQVTYKADDTKTGQTRRIPLNERAVEELNRWKKQSESEYLFPSKVSVNGHVSSITLAWDIVRGEAKLKSFRLYDLRHSFASKLVMNGVDLYTVSKLLGHADISTTQIYAHLSHDHLAEAVKLL